MEGVLSLYNQLYSDLVEETDAWLSSYVVGDLSLLLGSVLIIIVGFVAFKLIKRALNKV